MWTAKTPEAPIFVDITTIDKQKGLIVTISDTGFLQLSYLGTSPPSQQILPQNKQEMNYQQMDQEHQRLLGKIMSHENDERDEPTDKLKVGA